MLCHIILRQLNADREQASSQNNASEFKSNSTLVHVPVSRVKDIGSRRSHQHSERGTEDDFIDVQLREIGREVINEARVLIVDRYELTLSLTSNDIMLKATTKPPRTM